MTLFRELYNICPPHKTGDKIYLTTSLTRAYSTLICVCMGLTSSSLSARAIISDIHWCEAYLPVTRIQFFSLESFTNIYITCVTHFCIIMFGLALLCSIRTFSRYFNLLSRFISLSLSVAPSTSSSHCLAKNFTHFNDSLYHGWPAT